MKRIVVYGLGNNFIFSYFELSLYYNIIALSDGSKDKWGDDYFDHRAQNISSIPDKSYDYVVITPASSDGIRETLSAKRIQDYKIISLQQAFDKISYTHWIDKKYIRSDSCSEHLAFILYGGMGDMLIAKNWITKLLDKYKLPKETISLFFAENNLSDGKYIFSDVTHSDKCMGIKQFPNEYNDKHFDIVFRFCILPEVLFINEKYSDVNSALFDYAKNLFDENIRGFNRGFFTSRDYHKTLTKYFINRGKLYHVAFDIFDNLNTRANDKVSIPCCEDSKSLESVGLANKKYITLNTGLNTEYAYKKNTREWSFENWNKLAIEIKRAYPELTIVQVGLRLREQDDINADVHLNGYTNLEHIAVVLKNAFLHIDYDGGLVHVNHMVGGRSLVLMGPSSAKSHAYTENIYIESGVCGACEWTTPDWLSKCKMGYDCPKCMSEITVDMVLEQVKMFVEKDKGENFHGK